MGMFGPITGIWASRSPIQYQYFTSVLYPFATEDAVGVNIIPDRGMLWESPNDFIILGPPSLISGSLTPVISYITYNNWAIEDISPAIAITAGALNTVISYVIYENPIEDISPAIAITAGELNVVISHITYDNWAIEDISPAIAIISGSLT